MYKISIIGAGNVGGLAALRILSEGLGEIVLIDKAPGLARAKELDLKDSQALLGQDYRIIGSDDIKLIRDSHLVVITAGLARKPDMTREDLLIKNAGIIKELAQDIKQLSPDAIIIVVTNPVDIMTYLTLKITGFKPCKVIGMGISLDTSRFINLIAEELKVDASEVEAMVIGSHGEGMLPLSRLVKVKDKRLDEIIDQTGINNIIKLTVNRGAQIVSLLGSGSAYVAPSAAIADLVKAILKDENRVIGVSCYCNGEYGLKDICIGLPCLLNRVGIKKIIDLELNPMERESLGNSSMLLSKHIENIKKFL